MIQNLIFGVYLLISDILAEILKTNKTSKKKLLILQYSFRQKPHSFYEPPQLTSKHIPGWCHKKHLHIIISRRPTTALLK